MIDRPSLVVCMGNNVSRARALLTDGTKPWHKVLAPNMAGEPMQAWRYERGKRGEERAVRFLEGQGFTVIERNVRLKVGEIDVIARRGKELHFFEVKVRGEGSLIPARESFGARQQKRLRRAAEAYLVQHERTWKKMPEVSFGLVAIDLDGTKETIECIEHAFV